MIFRSRTLNQRPESQSPNFGGQGRIRTSVARKERQIYSLLPLAARPPVRTRNTPTQSENH